MRILLSSIYGTGHLLPLIPFARALLRRGHEVRVSAPPQRSADLTRSGLDHEPVDHPSVEQSRHILSHLVTLPPEERFRFVGEYAAMALPKVQETLRTWKPDLVLRESCEYASALAVEGSGITHARVEVLNPDAEVAFTSAAAEPLDMLRERIRLKPDGGASLRGGPAFSAFPPSFFDAGTRISGSLPFVLHETGSAVAPPLSDAAWMPQDGCPLICITFGTVQGELSNALAVCRAALEAMPICRCALC